MTSKNALDQAIERLMAIEWSTGFTFRRSHWFLMKEHLRRMALWAKALERERKWPFFDLAAEINPDIRANPDLIRELKRSIPIYPASMWKTIEWFLQWAELSGRQNIPFDLPAPYEPLIVMYERGGTMKREQSFIDTQGGTVTIRTIEDDLQDKPIVELRAKLLDQLDNAKREDIDQILKR